MINVSLLVVGMMRIGAHFSRIVSLYCNLQIAVS